MAKHQIIYTSCMRGIDGFNDGQQIYSYDVGFTESKSDEIKSLFTYQVPSLKPGVIMTEELAETMPASFAYRVLKTGKLALSLNTYLGRDYMGSTGRFGNHLSHSIVCDFEDMDMYPCEIYGSSTLRTSMEYKEVNSPEKPDYLPQASLDKGYLISPERIIDFLETDDNLDYYKKMIVAMLSFYENKKRLIICDSEENIIIWIAALHYALPLDIAKRVNFSTYVHDPELSSSQICGVIREGSRYNVGNYIASDNHYVFDFINSRFTELDINKPFLEFIDIAFSFSYDSLREFHDFVMDKTNFRLANEDIYAAYDLYTFLTYGVSEVKLSQFQAILIFVDEYTNSEMKLEVFNKLIEDLDYINKLDNDYVLSIIQYMLKTYDILNNHQEESVKEIIVNRLIVWLEEPSIEEEIFLELFEKINDLARDIKLSIPSELMKENNRKSLINVMNGSLKAWKVYFIIKIINDHVEDAKLLVDQLTQINPIGKLYFEIIKALFSTGESNGLKVVDFILGHFKRDGTNLINMTFTMEGIYIDLMLTDSDIKNLWKKFNELVIDLNMEQIEEINVILLESKRYDNMFDLYCKRMDNEDDLIKARYIFKDTFQGWFSKDQDYRIEYLEQVIEKYVELYIDKGSSLIKEDFKFLEEILKILIELELKGNYVNSLIELILTYVRLEKPNRKDQSLIKAIKEYQVNTCNNKISGKLLLLYIGMAFDKVAKSADIEKAINKISLFADEGCADIHNIEVEVIKDYFTWILATPLNYPLSTSDFENIFNLFVMPENIERIFIDYCGQSVFKKSKDKKDHREFAQFLKFMFDNGNKKDIDNTCSYLCKLNKKKSQSLNEEMIEFFKDDKKASKDWQVIYDYIESTNPLLHNLSGLFKRKRD